MKLKNRFLSDKRMFISTIMIIFIIKQETYNEFLDLIDHTVCHILRLYNINILFDITLITMYKVI